MPKAEQRKPYSRPEPSDGEGKAGGKGEGGKAGGKGKAGKAGKRQRITEIEITGELVEWKTGFGWINPYDTVEHAAAAKNDGKIRVAAADIQGEKKELEPGQLVQFHVFTDGTGGLGA